MAFPVIGRSHGLAAAPGHGQVALGTNKVALDLGGPVWGPRATLLAPSATWMAWRRRQAMGTPSNWERHNIRYPKTPGWGGVGWGGVGWGGVGWGVPEQNIRF